MALPYKDPRVPRAEPTKSLQKLHSTAQRNTFCHGFKIASIGNCHAFFGEEKNCQTLEKNGRQQPIYKNTGSL